MAAYDAQASNQTGGSNGAQIGSATALSFTGAAGAALVVHVQIAASAIDLTSTVMAVTYNGVSMSSLKRQMPSSTSSAGEIFGLLNACDGAAHNIAVTVASGNQPKCIIVGAISATSVGAFTGAVSSAPGVLTNSGNLAVTSGGTNDLVVGGGGHGDTISGAGSGTQRWVQTVDNFSSGANAAGSTVPGAAGTVNVSFTSAVSDLWVLLGVNLQDAGTAAPAAANQLVVPLLGPGSQGPMAWQWQQAIGAELGIVSEDHPTGGWLAFGAVPFADVTHDANVSAPLYVGTWPSSTVSTDRTVTGRAVQGTWPVALVSRDATVTGSVWHGTHPRALVTHDATVMALVNAGVVPYATVTHDATVVGLLEHGSWLAALITSTADISTAGLGLNAVVPMATVTHDAPISGVVYQRSTPMATVTHDATITGVVYQRSTPMATVSHDATITALLEAGTHLRGIVAGAVDISTAGLGIGAVHLRASPVSTDRSPSGLLELASFQTAAVSTVRSTIGFVPVAVVPVGLVTVTHNVVGLLVVGVGAAGQISPPFVIGIARSTLFGPGVTTVLLDASAAGTIVGPDGTTTIVGPFATSDELGGDAASTVRIEED